MNHQLLKKITLLLALLLCSTFIASGQTASESQAAKRAEHQADESDGGELIENIKRGDLTEVATILFAGTSADAVDEDGGRPLCWAIRVNRRDIIELLLANGADVNKEEDDGSAALDVAAVFGHGEMVKLLLSHGALVDHKDHGGHAALIAAAMGATIRDMPPFLLRAMWGEKRTNKHEQLLSNLGKEYKTVMELLLEAGADVNLQADDCGMTTLMVAALGGSTDLVQLLLSHGAKVSLKSDDWDALGFAEALESPQNIANLIADEDEEAKQALLIWVQSTAPGRQQVTKILRDAGARN